MPVQKILELKGKNMAAGISLQTGFSIGGVFSAAVGFDPFEDYGYLKASLQATAITAPADSATVLTNYVPVSSANPYVFAHTPTHLYRYNAAAPYTQTDFTSSIDVTAPVAGACIWKNKYIYAQPTSIRSWNFASTDVQILNGSNNSDLNIRKLLVGPDLQLYAADYTSISKCILATGTTGNLLNVFNIDDGYTVRDIVTDGLYLIIIADNNTTATTTRTTGTYDCKVYYWDMDTTRTTANRIWNIQDSYLIGAQVNNGTVYIWGANGLYVCNYTTEPKIIMDATGPSSALSKMPTNPYQTTQDSNTVYWGDGGVNGQNVWAYGGFPGIKGSIFYSPYITHTGSLKHTALNAVGTAFFAATSQPGIVVHNVGTTRGNLTVQTAPVVFDNPYLFSHIKISLKKPLATGQAVAVEVLDGNGSIISDNTTQTYNAANPKKNLLFKRTATNSTHADFEDISLIINSQGGAEISRISMYASPQDDANVVL